MLSTVYHIRDIIGTFLKISEYLKLSYNNLFIQVYPQTEHEFPRCV